MTVTLTALLRDAWASWRHDKELLIAIAGPFVFLPTLAILLIVLPTKPELPPGTDPAAAATLVAYQRDVALWLVRNSPWLLAQQLVSLYGQFAIVGLYLSGTRAEVGAVLLAALKRLPVLLLALIVVAIPTLTVGMAFALVPLLLPGFFLVMVVVTARAMLLMPVLHAESPIGALAAVGRSFRATHGHTFMLVASILTVYLAMIVAGWPFSAFEAWMADAPNPVARVIADSFQAAVTALGAIAIALLQVAAYRRLSSR